MLKRLTNPFRFNQVVAKEFFCNRSESTLLKGLIESGQNVALIGPRRTGKTSLALEVCRKAKRSVIHVDMMRVDSYAEVIKRLIEASVRDAPLSRVENFIKSLAHLRPTFAIDPISGSTSWTVAPSARSTPQNVIDTLRIIKQRCEQQSAILFIDEFQDLTALPKHETFIGQMRAETQQWGDIAIIYAGSDRDLMKALFTDPANPFYQSATVLTIEAIDTKPFTRYIHKRFEQTDKKIDDPIIDKVLQVTESHPNSAQKLLHFIWSLTPTGKTADTTEFDAALEVTVRAEQDEFERTLDNLTLMQVRALKTVAQLGGENTVSIPFLEAARIRNPSSASKALQRCVQLKILLKDGPRYRFTNPFFQYWLKTSR